MRVLIFYILSILSSCGHYCNVESNTGRLFFILSIAPNSPINVANYTKFYALPITSWNANVKNILIMFSDQHNIIKCTYSIYVPPSKDDYPVDIQNIPIGIYNVDVIANSDDEDILTTNYKDRWAPINVQGKNVNGLILSLSKNSSYIPRGKACYVDAYNAPPNIFTAHQANVKINLNEETNINTTIVLSRLVSLIRVRINQSQGENKYVNFNDPKADIQIQNASSYYNMLTVIDTSKFYSSLIYEKVFYCFKYKEPIAGYSKGEILSIDEEITLWDDIIIFPNNINADFQTQIVVSAKAPDSYVPIDTKVPLLFSTNVYCVGVLNQSILPNHLLEINCTLNST